MYVIYHKIFDKYLTYDMQWLDFGQFTAMFNSRLWAETYIEESDVELVIQL